MYSLKRYVKRRRELGVTYVAGGVLKKESIHYGAVSYIMSLRNKKASIRYDTEIERKYPLCHCVPR